MKTIPTFHPLVRSLLSVAGLAAALFLGCFANRLQAATEISLTTLSTNENFDAIGTTATASLPAGWVMSAAGVSAPVYAASTNLTAVTQQASSGSPSTGARYNWGNGTTTSDRAIGFMTSGSYASPNSIMVGYVNNTGGTIGSVTVTFDCERYRINTAAAQVNFYYSTDGSTWTAATTGDSGAFSTGASAYNFTSGTVVSKSVPLTGLNLAAGSKIYFRWNFNTTGASSQGLGLDNFTLTATPSGPSIVRVETAADGSGSVLLATNLTAGNSVTVYAIARDSGGGYIANSNATWSLVSKTAGVANGDLVPAGDNKSATFTGHLLGTAAIHAVAGGLATTDSGTITVRAGAATQVRVETLANGGGIVVPATNVAPGNALTVYAIQRDTYGNFVTNIPATAWSLPTKTDGVVDGDLVASGDSKNATFTGAVPGTATIRATSGGLPATDSGVVTVPASPTPPTGSGVADPANVAAGQSTTLKVTVSPGATPVSSGLAVTADLTAIGGSANQSLADSGGGLFSYLATVDAGTSAGLKSLPVTIWDAETRTNTTAISLNVGVAPGVTAPVSLTNNATTTATFTVTGSGTAPLSYQWLKGASPLTDGGKVSGATTGTLTITNVLAAEAGSYSVVVTNLFGSITSAVATLTVVDPVITTPPSSRTNNAGTTATFSVAAVGTTPLGYQWLKGGAILTDGGNVTGAVTATLTMTNVGPSNPGDYSVVVSNSNSSVTSSVATLTVIDLVITKHPSSRTNSAGDNAAFSATAAGTSLTYQWQLNGADLTGATNNSLTRSNVGAADVGNYWVVVSNYSGTLTSATAVLTVVGANATKLAQWNFNGSSISPSAGSGTASLVGGATATFAAGTSSDPTGTPSSGWNTAGYPTQGTGNKSRGAQFAVSTLGYTNVIVAWEQQDSNTGSKYSRLQYTTNGTDFVDGPVITLPTGTTFFYETADLSAVPGVANNASFAFRLMAEWEATAIGTANSNYVAVTSGSSYGTAGTMRYDLMSIFAEPLPLVITAAPVDASVECGSPASFSVTASGAPPLSYQWRANGTPIAGSNSTALSFNPAKPASAGQYDVVVSNPFASVTSAVVTLTAVDTMPPTLRLPADIVTPQTLPAGAVVSFTASAADACAGSLSVACLPESGSVFPLGATTVRCTADDGSGNTASNSFQVTVERQWVQVSGSVALEFFVGPARDGAGHRTVTFVASDDATNKLATVDLALDFTGGSASFTLTNLPVAMTHLSAKTAWTLRTRLPATFTDGAAVVNFTGDSALLGGDFDGSNSVGIEDYFQLAVAWYQSDAAADVDGSGLVDVDDYFILASHWYMEGDPE